MPGEQGCQHISGEILFVFLPSAISLWFSGQQLASWLEGKNSVPSLGARFAFAQAGAAGMLICLGPGRGWPLIFQLFLELWHPGFDLAKIHPYLLKLLQHVYRKKTRQNDPEKIQMSRDSLR